MLSSKFVCFTIRRLCCGIPRRKKTFLLKISFLSRSDLDFAVRIVHRDTEKVSEITENSVSHHLVDFNHFDKLSIFEENFQFAKLIKRASKKV